MTHLRGSTSSRPVIRTGRDRFYANRSFAELALSECKRRRDGLRPVLQEPAGIQLSAPPEPAPTSAAQNSRFGAEQQAQARRLAGANHTEAPEALAHICVFRASSP